MDSKQTENRVRLWSVTFPNQTNIMSKSVKTLRSNSQDKPYVEELVWLVDRRIVRVVLEAHEEMPNVALIPQEALSVIVPMPKKATKAKLPDEMVSSSKFSKDGVVSDKEWVKDRGIKTDLGENKPMPKATEEEISNPTGGKPDVLFVNNPIPKPKPKKRGRPKKK